MSDLFVSEILVLALLLPVIIRPFIKNLRGLEGIATLPLVSLLFSVLTVVAHGLNFSLIILIVYAILVFFISLPRFIRFVLKLPTDFFSPISTVGYIFLCLIFLALTTLLFISKPELHYHTEQTIKIQSKMQLPEKGTLVSFLTWEKDLEKKVDEKHLEKEEQTKNEKTLAKSDLENLSDNSLTKTEPKAIVLLLSDSGQAIKSRPTLATILAENNYLVLEASVLGSYAPKNFGYSNQSQRSFVFIINKLLKKETKAKHIELNERLHKKQLKYLQDYVNKNLTSTKNIDVFICAEGTAANYLVSNPNEVPQKIKSLILLNESNVNKDDLNKESFFILDATELMPLNASQKQNLALFAPNDYLLGYGELAANDVLLSNYLKAPKDKNRKKAVITARKVLSWLEQKIEKVENNDNK